MIKDTVKKTRRPKNYTFSAEEVSKMASCSISYVKQIRQGKIENTETELAKRVIAIDEIGEQGKSLLIKEVERVVKLAV